MLFLSHFFFPLVVPSSAHLGYQDVGNKYRNLPSEMKKKFTHRVIGTQVKLSMLPLILIYSFQGVRMAIDGKS